MTTTDRSEEYTLGQDVTHLALGQSRDTVILSVRMTRDDRDRLEKLGNALGKPPSEVVRDAIAAYRVETAAG